MLKISLTILSQGTHERTQNVRMMSRASQECLMYVQYRSSQVCWDCLYCVLVVFISTCGKISTVLLIVRQFCLSFFQCLRVVCSISICKIEKALKWRGASVGERVT